MKTAECLAGVNNLIKELEELQNTTPFWAGMDYKRHYWKRNKRCFKIRAIYNECNIFDWWNDYLSMSQLKQMKSFLETAIKLGFTGYACFKVGAAGCSHGMWANKKESTNGYSPDGACLFHSFRSGDSYWDYCDDNNKWYGTNKGLTLKEVKEAMSCGN